MMQVCTRHARLMQKKKTTRMMRASTLKFENIVTEGSGKYLSIRVDCSGLKEPMRTSPSTTNQEHKSRMTPLVPILSNIIGIRGPLTMSDYMQRVSTHPAHGYYMKKDVFGSKGDFITAPEISQMFGELIAIWCIAIWQKMGSPSSINVVELGPGRGSLMSDFLRASQSFPTFKKAIQIHMVEISPELGRLQKIQLEPYASIPIQWHSDFKSTPREPSLVIAQEFFDAMPVHQFQRTERGWCERLVDIDDGEGDDYFRFVLSPGPTPAARIFLEKKYWNEGQIGDKMEVSPASVTIAQDIARRISEFGGAALIIDYGRDHPSSCSVRGIKNHEWVSVLQEPGDVDLSADVDFRTLRNYAVRENDVECHGPVDQGEFLRALGIDHRLTALLQNCESEVEQQELHAAYERLVDGKQMGSIFKAMSLTHASLGKPVGF